MISIIKTPRVISIQHHMSHFCVCKSVKGAFLFLVDWSALVCWTHTKQSWQTGVDTVVGGNGRVMSTTCLKMIDVRVRHLVMGKKGSLLATCFTVHVQTARLESTTYWQTAVNLWFRSATSYLPYLNRSHGTIFLLITVPHCSSGFTNSTKCEIVFEQTKVKSSSASSVDDCIATSPYFSYV